MAFVLFNSLFYPVHDHNLMRKLEASGIALPLQNETSKSIEGISVFINFILETAIPRL